MGARAAWAWALGAALDSGDSVVAPGAGRSMSCSRKRPSRPTTPVTTPVSEAGTCGDAVLTMARADSPGACTDSSGVPSAAETTEAVPLTGNNVLPGPGVPTVSPWPRSTEDTCATSAGAGPYCGRKVRGGEVLAVFG